MTPDDWDGMLEEQDGGCGICGTTEPGGHGRFHTDHDHATDEVRGLLCTGCNVKLATLEDGDFVEKATAYLRRHEERRESA